MINIEHSAAGICFYGFPYHIPISFWDAQTSWLGVRSVRWDLLPSRFIGREGSLGQHGMPFPFNGQSASGRAILPFNGIYAFSIEVSPSSYL